MPEELNDENENNLKTNETEYESKEVHGVSCPIEQIMAEREQMQQIIEAYDQQLKSLQT